MACFSCRCGIQFSIVKKNVGKKGRCPNCGRVLIIPQPGNEAVFVAGPIKSDERVVSISSKRRPQKDSATKETPMQRKSKVVKKHGQDASAIQKQKDISVSSKQERVYFSCRCGKRLAVDKRDVGKQGKCPKCGEVLIAPQSDTEESLNEFIGFVCNESRQNIYSQPDTDEFVNKFDLLNEFISDPCRESHQISKPLVALPLKKETKQAMKKTIKSYPAPPKKINSLKKMGPKTSVAKEAPVQRKSKVVKEYGQDASAIQKQKDISVSSKQESFDSDIGGVLVLYGFGFIFVICSGSDTVAWIVMGLAVFGAIFSRACRWVFLFFLAIYLMIECGFFIREKGW